MRKSYVMAVVLVAIATVCSAQFQFIWPTFPVKKGVIDSAWVEPEDAIASAAVTLHVSLADCLELDRVETRRLGTMFMVKLYWVDPSAGGDGAPAYHEEPLGMLGQGRYMVYIQSYYKARPVDSERVFFQVKAGPSQGPGDNIDNVWIDPEDPTVSDTITVHVSGKWPTSGYGLVGLVTGISGKSITVDMYWLRPTLPVLQVVTPYERNIILHHLSAGTYTLRVNCYLNRRRVDWGEMVIDVKPDDAG